VIQDTLAHQLHPKLMNRSIRTNQHPVVGRVQVSLRARYTANHTLCLKFKERQFSYRPRSENQVTRLLIEWKEFDI
jgi:hypothetical protein